MKKRVFIVLLVSLIAVACGLFGSVSYASSEDDIEGMAALLSDMMDSEYDMRPEKMLEKYLDIENYSVEAYGDHYVVCSKIESGFSETKEYYSVYDWLNDEWTLESQEVPIETEFQYAGEGMFFFLADKRSASPFYLINAEEGEVYEISGFYESSNWGSVEWEMNFHNGYDVDIRSYEDGTDVFVIDRFGTIWNAGVNDLFGDDWDRNLLFHDSNYIAYIAEYDGESCIAVQDLEGQLLCTIDDPAYVSRFTERGYDSSVSVSVTDDYIVLLNMRGEDENNYCAAFDMDGELVVEATECDFGYVNERGNLILVKGDNAEEIVLQNTDLEMKKITSLPALFQSEEVEREEVAADMYGNLYTDVLSYGNIFRIDDNPLPYELEESWFLGGGYERLTGTVFVEYGRSDYMSCSLWIVGDDNRLLYQSDVITNVTKPFEIDVDISGESILHIGYSGNLGGSSNHDHIMMADLTLWPDSETTISSNDDSGDSGDEVARQEEDTLLSFLHAYIGDLLSYGSVTDNMGNSYANNFIAYGGDYSATYDIGGKYSRFSATVAVTKAEVNTALFSDNYASLRIIGDGKVLYENALLGVDTKPFEIELDVTGVVDLTIEMSGKDTNLNYDTGLYLILADAMLHI